MLAGVAAALEVGRKAVACWVAEQMAAVAVGGRAAAQVESTGCQQEPAEARKVEEGWEGVGLGSKTPVTASLEAAARVVVERGVVEQVVAQRVLAGAVAVG